MKLWYAECSCQDRELRCPDFKENRIHWFKASKLNQAVRLFLKLREAARRHHYEARSDNPWMRYYSVHIGGKHIMEAVHG